MARLIFRILILSLLVARVCRAQQVVRYNLQQLYAGQQLLLNSHSSLIKLADDVNKGISVTGFVWLTNVNFSTGSIDVDLRGRDVFQQSFLGIAFHGVDSVTYDAVYFRPFNFHSDDTLRRKHTVQYMAEPDYPWERLRKEHPLVYESGIASAPVADAWFHAHIVVGNEEIKVYVNHSKTPALVVKKLDDRAEGLIGLWDDGLPGSFANLVITNDK